MKNKKGIVLMTIGIFLILCSFGLLIYNRYEDNQAAKSSEQAIQEIRNEISKTQNKKEEMPIVDIEEDSYIGYLSIPSLELELPVMSDWSYDRLNIAPCRQYGSTLTDDLVIAAHNYQSHFAKIEALKYNDRIFFTNMNGETIEYVVQISEVLKENQGNEMLFSDWDLTLYTCNYSGNLRITIRANRLSS